MSVEEKNLQLYGRCESCGATRQVKHEYNKAGEITYSELICPKCGAEQFKRSRWGWHLHLNVTLFGHSFNLGHPH